MFNYINKYNLQKNLLYHYKTAQINFYLICIVQNEQSIVQNEQWKYTKWTMDLLKMSNLY